MAKCPFCQSDYMEYTIVGIIPANEHLTDWLDPMPLAQMACGTCGRLTFMHPDHPDVQRLRKSEGVEFHSDNVRTLNVPLREIGDPELQEQFRRGRDEA